MLNHRINLLFYLAVIAVTGCSPETKIQIEKGAGQEQLIVEEFDPMEYLNNSISNSTLYKGTEKYNYIIKKEKVIFERILRNDLFDNEKPRSKKDSIRSWIKKDTLYVSHIFLAKGRCLNLYPYLEKASGFLELNAPEVIDATAFIEDGDTLIETTGCALMNIVEFIFKIPTNKISKTTGVKYNRQTIEVSLGIVNNPFYEKQELIKSLLQDINWSNSYSVLDSIIKIYREAYVTSGRANTPDHLSANIKASKLSTARIVFWTQL